jgi:hypothetical protein
MNQVELPPAVLQGAYAWPCAKEEPDRKATIMPSVTDAVSRRLASVLPGRAC